MAQSIVIDTIEKTHTSTQYGYDAFGRRNLVQDQGSSTMRTLYDGFSFDIVQEAEVFQGGDFTTSYMELGSIQYTQTQTGTSRYRYVGDDPKTVTLGDLTQESTRYTGSRATLYANGQAVATNRSASLYDNGRAYFGTDILGSVRSATDDYATLEDRYEYDIFGTPYEGDFTSGLNNGYTGKPYDTTTGLYNYGYRDYSPQQARFTTVDPIRDGNNWFSYVVNDPVNYVDLWGLCSSDANKKDDEPLKTISDLLNLGKKEGSASVNEANGGKALYVEGEAVAQISDHELNISGEVGVANYSTGEHTTSVFDTGAEVGGELEIEGATAGGAFGLKDSSLVAEVGAALLTGKVSGSLSLGEHKITLELEGFLGGAAIGGSLGPRSSFKLGAGLGWGFAFIYSKEGD